MTGLAELCVLLQRERLLLELLVFKLAELGHLLSAGDPRFLGWAAEEVERAVEAVRVCELDRAVHVQDAARAVLSAAATDERAVLVRLVETAEQPYADQLEEHRQALTALTVEVAEQLRNARVLAEAGSGALAAMFDRVGAPSGPPPALLTYGPGSTTAWSAPAPRLRTTL